jgi:hypothetical protein
MCTHVRACGMRGGVMWWCRDALEETATALFGALDQDGSGVITHGHLVQYLMSTGLDPMDCTDKAQMLSTLSCPACLLSSVVSICSLIDGSHSHLHEPQIVLSVLFRD